jgi:hypothetical protein
MTVKMKKIRLVLLISGIITLISLIVFVLTSIPFFLHFRQCLISNNSQDWGAFGSYISGLTSIINLAVFIILTIYVARLGDTNSDKQIIAQKKILISQFRQNEINLLNDQLDKAFNFTGYERKGELINTYNSVSIFLTNFLNQKKYLFPILKDEIVENKIKILLDKYDQLALIVDEIHGVPESEIESWKTEKLGTKIQFTITIKNELIEILQQFVLNDL